MPVVLGYLFSVYLQNHLHKVHTRLYENPETLSYE